MHRKALLPYTRGAYPVPFFFLTVDRNSNVRYSACYGTHNPLGADNQFLYAGLLLRWLLLVLFVRAEGLRKIVLPCVYCKCKYKEPSAGGFLFFISGGYGI